MKQRLRYLAFFLLLLNVAFFSFAVLPARRAVRAHATTLEALQVRIRSLRLEQRDQSLVASALEGMEHFRSRIPPQGAILQMIRRITDQARRLKLHIPSVKYQPGEVPEEEMIKLTVQMDVEGPYAAIRRFLYEVEGLQDPLLIEKLVLTSQREVDRLTLQLQMAAYFLTEGGSTKPAKEKRTQEVEIRAEG